MTKDDETEEISQEELEEAEKEFESIDFDELRDDDYDQTVTEEDRSE